MYIRQGYPIPDELKPLPLSVYNSFIENNIKNNICEKTKLEINKIRPEWFYLSMEDRLEFLKSLHRILFIRLCPLPKSKIIYERKRFVATFHPEKWEILYSQNFFHAYSCDRLLKTWIHETFHAILHFGSLRYNSELADECFNVPEQILEFAIEKGQLIQNESFTKLAYRNLLGSYDRMIGNEAYINSVTSKKTRAVLLKGEYNTSIISIQNENTSLIGSGLDSYYLNVEISVENLTEILYQKLIPLSTYHRSYPRAEDYIAKRLKGIAPLFICG